MTHPFLTALALVLAFSSPALGQVADGGAAPSAEQGDMAAAAQRFELVHVLISTDQGDMVLALEKQRAPLTTANFLRYVDQKRLDGTKFYRAAAWGPDYGLIQGGVQYDPKRVLPPVAHEPTGQTGLKHVSGTISMARAAPGTATGDFFIVVGDMPSLDANPDGTGDAAGFAAFGHVVQGMDVVRRILGAPTRPDAGPPGMKGQMIAEPVRIVSVRRTSAPDAEAKPPVAGE